jgi:hypothetical protein
VDEIEPRRAVTGEEVDAHSRFRHYMRWRPGQRAAVKRRTNRRERHERKVDVERRLRDETS